MVDTPVEEMDEIVGEFIVESLENLERWDSDLLALEDDPTDRTALSSVFRTMHTIKGTCGFLGFTILEDFAHVAESLLGRLRDGELVLDRPTADLLLDSGDAVRAMLAAIEETGTETVDPPTRLRARLTAAAGGDGADEAEDEAPAGPKGGRLGELLIRGGYVTAEDIDLALYSQDLGDKRPIGEILVDQGKVTQPQVEELLSAQAISRGGGTETVRVDVAVLDRLMTLVGELVLARNEIVSMADTGGHGELSAAAQRLDVITTELQESAMRARMQPVGTAWQRLPRVVRDVANANAKRVDLVREGEDIELDRTVLEAIKDPLTHLVRNAVDHGIEDSDERRAAAKPAVGTLTLRALHEGGQVVIEVSDDGRGIDVDRLLRRAVERGVVASADVPRMGEREILDLVFRPGLSTVDTVTNVSGRGVGMDVVRTNVEAIGGTVEVTSCPGHGATFAMRIPLTLAIVPALLVAAAGRPYALPQGNLVELVRVDRAEPGGDAVAGGTHRWRGNVLPLLHLADHLGGRPEPTADGAVTIAVLQADGRHFGVVVDAVGDTSEIVVKPLPRQLRSIEAFAGATILGDGRLALILDVGGLARAAFAAPQLAIGTAEPVAEPADGRVAAARPADVVRLGMEA